MDILDKITEVGFEVEKASVNKVGNYFQATCAFKDGDHLRGLVANAETEEEATELLLLKVNESLNKKEI